MTTNIHIMNMVILINGLAYNDVSNYFMQDLRLNGSYGFDIKYGRRHSKRYLEVYRILCSINGVQKKVIKETDGTETERLINELSEKSYTSAFRLGTYIATQFKPYCNNL